MKTTEETIAYLKKEIKYAEERKKKYKKIDQDTYNIWDAIWQTLSSTLDFIKDGKS